MTEFATIIGQLERQRIAIETALGALRGLDGTAGPASAAEVVPAASPEVSTRKGQRRSAAVRKRMQEAQRLRWAKIKGETEPPAPVSVTSRPKRQISAAGMRNIIEATKRRWKLKRAEEKAALEKAEAKKAARKKPVAKATKKMAPVKRVTAKKSAAPAPVLAEAAG